MKRLILYFLLFVGVVNWIGPIVNVIGKNVVFRIRSRNPNVRYDDLALKKCNSSSEWSIHGWWPEYDIHHWPSWCNRSQYNQFNVSLLSPGILHVMDIYWNTCLDWTFTKEALWKHEWEKHATCIVDESVQHYFKHTLEAFLDARAHNFYSCCDDKKIECLIPFSRNKNIVKWLGRC